MNIINKFFSRKENHSLVNPYVKGAKGRQEWNDRYGNMQNAIRSWKFAFFASVIVNIIFAIVIAKIATSSKIKPFIVETSHGTPVAIKALSESSIHDPNLITYALNQFIINTKTIVVDEDAQKKFLDKVYAYAANRALPYINEYFQKNNPFDINKEYIVTVNIENTLPLSKNTYQITWNEIKRNKNSNTIVEKTHWMANLTYQFGDVTERFILENPFGFYITELSWSKNQNNLRA